MKFGLDIKKQYPINIEPKPKKNTKLKLLDGDILPFKPDWAIDLTEQQERK